ncbi:3-oxoacyl-ACP synthase [Zobellella denitrificans]|jgi:3-oxoacyl-[acyl-carrier-protein] synthase III|uniref:Beta-ketoacyl-[acyl-carrier-protein] synthase III n=1 Tax=Zobellella denitrificans TaxID=347534 RepID=A0A231N482_9GAMM|nr:ketoacyl-ACP synthase III [Zobellella denitrificans]ATG74815.1 3-oxoacyl-ACP synthase [Zobellella denitrificans]OXS16686.1 3-oxoacyl-ACP synthase [Zobellella denitrificans]
MRYANITGWGKCLPPAMLSNDDLSTFLDTSDDWIHSRTGIRERRIAHVNTSELAVVAARHALAAAGLDAGRLDGIILATASPDSLVPSAASAVQQALGAGRAAVFDINAACTGFLYALSVGNALIKAGSMQRILVIGAERLTHYLDWTQRDTAVLFGDGAGAVVLEAGEEPQGVIADKLGCDAEAREILAVPDSGTCRRRFAHVDGLFEVNFEGKEIFKRAVKGMGDAAAMVLEQAGVTGQDIDLLLPHQANIRIIETLAKKMELPEDKVMVNIGRYGNTSAATVPIALCEALEQGRIKPGALLLTAAFGAGLTWGAALIRWGERITPLAQSDAALPPCEQTALELLAPAIEGCRRAHGG